MKRICEATDFFRLFNNLTGRRVMKRDDGGSGDQGGSDNAEWSELGRRLAQRRWEKERALRQLPQIIRRDLSDFETARIACVLVTGSNQEGTRGEDFALVTKSTVLELIGRRNLSAKQRRNAVEGADFVALMPEALRDHLPPQLRECLEQPIAYREGERALGYHPRILLHACDAWLRAHRAGALQNQQSARLQLASDLFEALTRLGEDDFCRRIAKGNPRADGSFMEAITGVDFAEKPKEWDKRFPDEFYRQIARLRGEVWKADTRRPKHFVHVADRKIYRMLREEVRKRLPRHKRPGGRKGKSGKKSSSRPSTKARNHQHFDNDEIELLQQHVSQVVAIMRLSKDWKEFQRLFAKAFPGIHSDRMVLTG